VALLLAVGLLATVAQLMMTRAYATGRTLVNASLQYLGIAFSFGYGVLLFNDKVTWMALAGMLLIVGAGPVRDDAAQPTAPPTPPTRPRKLTTMSFTTLITADQLRAAGAGPVIIDTELDLADTNSARPVGATATCRVRSTCTWTAT